MVFVFIFVFTSILLFSLFSACKCEVDFDSCLCFFSPLPTHLPLFLLPYFSALDNFRMGVSAYGCVHASRPRLYSLPSAPFMDVGCVGALSSPWALLLLCWFSCLIIPFFLLELPFQFGPHLLLVVVVAVQGGQGLVSQGSPWHVSSMT